MKLIVGLGNPGPKYETTRHNIGFLAIDRLIDRWNARGPDNKENAETWNAKLGDEKLLLAKPQTFMNRSGKSVGPLFHFYKMKPHDLIVIYDDVDLRSMQIRIKTGGGAGGHNGIRSLDDSVGGDHKDYIRVRLGIGRPDLLPSGAREMPTDQYVLQAFSDEELKNVDPLLDRVAEAVEVLIEGDIKKAMNEYNRKDGNGV